ncbi:hypothetical protein P171DRAFT_476961 [Karstenula rhodostoma CBS 690.94]|uniref:F-box domain-containing protein n=1 Tax=Karstenula rhodostoma CBS 690.94 TaxID=1392251 RepID=A0A9P4U7M5_9PLEO|nr:hypothetical protein P171DRAFT_476961 [Karstenula rhodostoma CBS 690.94]
MEEGTADNGQSALLSTKEEHMSQLATSRIRDSTTTELYTDIKSPPRLDNLPAEIIRRIISHLREDTDPIYDEDTGTTETTVLDRFRHDSENYRSVALASRVFTPWAQELLVDSPVLFHPQRFSAIREPSPFSFLARTLLERPDLRRKVRQLTVFLPTHNHAISIARRGLWGDGPDVDSANNVLEPGRIYQARRRLHQNSQNPEGASCQLEKKAEDTIPVPSYRHYPDSGNQQSLIIRGPAPVSLSGLEFFPAIRKLHLRLEFHPNRRAGLHPLVISSTSFQNISKLRLACAQVWSFRYYKPNRLLRPASGRVWELKASRSLGRTK